jgi:2-haloacid dehalogenase
MIDGLLGRRHIPYREIERLAPFPDVIKALQKLKDAGLKLVILSNGTRTCSRPG